MYRSPYRLVHGGRFRRFLRTLPWGKIIKKTFQLGIVAALLGSLTLLAAFAWYSRDLPDPNSLLTRDVSQSTKIYDRSGAHLLYEVAPDENRTLITIDQVPEYLKQATITAEDRKFYEHHGIDYLGLVRAVVVNTIKLSRIKGTSTITQQLVKNAILSSERSYVRKLKEFMLSIAIERTFSKDQILQMYLNEIGYGSTNYGVEAAAHSYFGKSAKDVSLAEAATLAALPNQPSRFLNNPDLLVQRRDWILNSMAELGYISKEQAEEAIKTDTALALNLHNITAPHFVMWVKGQLEDEYGATEVETGGFKVITTLDYDKQLIAEEAVKNGVEMNGEKYSFKNGALLAIDPKTGEVLSMVGSPDFFDEENDGQVNVTLRSLQPGSSIKPIVYAAAFEKGYTPDTLLWDVTTTFPTETGDYQPKNYDETEHGLVSMRKALQGSLNIASVKTLYLLGIEKALAFATRLGYTTLNDPSKVGLSMVLGGAEVKMIDHVAAYGAFANGGKRVTPFGILKVENKLGEVVEEKKIIDGPQVLDQKVVSAITNVLADNNARSYVFGANNYLTLGDRPVAAKTGTTNDFNDAWTVGYTPSIVTGVWVGNANGAPMSRGADGSKIAAPIWNEFMRRALLGEAVEGFPEYIKETTGKSVLDGILPQQVVTVDEASGKLATDRTPESFRETLSCGEYHTILKYLSKDDPRGAAPSDPNADPYYSVFEAAISDYISRHNANLKEGEVALSTCTPPTEYDDVHVKKNIPNVRLISPDGGDSVGRAIEIKTEIEIKRSYSRTAVFLDGSLIGTIKNRDGGTVNLPAWVQKGAHSLTVTVYDDVDNSGSAGANISVNQDGANLSIRITNPFNSQTIEKTESFYRMVVEVPGASEVKKLSVRARSLWTGAEKEITVLESATAINQIDWFLPEAGEYVLEADGILNDGSVIGSEPVTVMVTEPVVVKPVEETGSNEPAL